MPRLEDATSEPDAPHRLPRTVEPQTYRLILEPDLDLATFSGSVEIDLSVMDPVDELVLNAAELEIDHAAVSVGGLDLAATISLDEANERASFALSQTLPTGPAVLRCRFRGVLNDKLRGFYRSTFTDPEGVNRTIATTQMESTDARRAFPCWDEPDRKAVFDVTLVVDASLAAFSNSPVASQQELGDGRRRVHFAPTMKMSTYLVAFVVGPLVATEPVDVDGVPVRIVHVPGRQHLTRFALDVAAHALRFFTGYFGIPYPADKLDLVAIPDFAFGAMENLGCVTFRETALLVDPDSAARTELERVADVVCHEIAHMWFGDLVTMRWWEGIWLNEAFATFMEVLCVDAYRPAWQRWVSFGLEREAAMAVDGLHTTRPIEYAVGSPEEADGMFDVLTYQKGGSVLRMLEQYLGPTVFRDGVRVYLERHAHANTETRDLWRALEATSGQPVSTVMDTWILQGGHPLVSSDGRSVSQRPFAYLDRAELAKERRSAGKPASPDPGTADDAIGEGWKVPVLVRSVGLTAADGPTPERLLLEDAPLPLPLPQPQPAPGGQDAVQLLNAGGWGVYRVGYGPDQLQQLSGRLPALDELERFNLLADTWALALAGLAPVDALLALATNLGDEEEPSTWTVVAGALSLLDRLVDEDRRPALAAAVRALFGTQAARLGWDKAPGEGERAPTLRALLIQTLGTVGIDHDIRREAARRFDAASAGTPIDADLETAVLHSVAVQLRPGDYDAMLEHYRHPANPQQELRYLTSLAAFPDPDLAQRTFELARHEVRTQNAPYLVAALLANRVGGPPVWEEVKAHWDELLGRFPVNSHSRMLDSVRLLCGEPALADDVTRFLRDHRLQTGQRSVRQTLERLRVNVAFGERVASSLGASLEAVEAAAGHLRPAAGGA